MNPKVLAKIGEDFRKAGYLMGAGFVGMVISNDQISTSEGFVLFCGDCIFGLSGISHYIILRKYLIQSKENRNESVLLGAAIGTALLATIFIVLVTWANRDILFTKSDKPQSK